MDKIMTPEEFAAKLRVIEQEYEHDKEAMHSAADDLMCKLLRQLGYKEGVKVFDAMDKWYA